MRDTTDNESIDETSWFKSSYSGAGSGSDCVEAARIATGAAFRDTKNKAGGVLRFTNETMSAFIGDVKHGVFDLPDRQLGHGQ
ncbi:DUF397 domain-containing protein [Streptomyces sp. JW3]|uniref:DUF397 domain-containing protein n=1 Tax=Streptomyces sp. JW3 TaxID=3456955 RepID=UPI003FA4B72D